eukprot:COSAG04_NODE_23548_length_336_cov_1.080169_1_plen_64_part_10
MAWAGRGQQGNLSPMARWLAIDTDAGVDDAVALTLALTLGPRLGFELAAHDHLRQRAAGAGQRK